MKTKILLSTLLATSLLFSSFSFAKKEEKKLYEVKANALALKKGEKGKASFDILLKKGAKVHPQAPFKCKVSSSDALKLEKNKLGHKDTLLFPKAKPNQKEVVKANKVIVPVGVTAVKTGKAHVDMDCSFFICTKEICARKVEKVKITTSVQ